ncbi:hypothetical protein BGZ79_009859 [Entomortierella chlamydospora]|nr:hypothetical protein BGZ79_009859 [Entomortierella chlamydospora]
MGVFGEKHTSLTREQKRQLIRQADAHKLRPTEVCDWVLATWGLRIARVTVYSILHKQRASLMAGHKDLYSAMQGGHSGDACNGQSTKYRTSKRARSANSGARGDSVGCDLPSTSHVGEGARWEGQLKRVREPASVELDRAMVQFLKSSEAVDAHGRRLNDAELQSHALRLAREIPSASRMRCSFGWLRHFKRRLGVQWAADQLGRYRWIVEMDPFASNTEDSQDDTQSSANVGTTSGEKSLSSDAPISASRLSHTNSSSRCHGNIKREHDDKKTQQSIIDEKDDDADEDEEYHSSQELLGKDYDLITPTIVDANKSSPSPFEMGVDGGVRKVPSKDEAYDMLQSLLLYYEQDHHYVGEQQTLLLPRWIHQQRQVMQEADINEAKMMWMRQRHSTHQQTQTSPFSSSSPTPSTPSYTPYSLPSQSLPNSSYSQAQTHRSESTCSSPPSSPPSTSSPITTSSTLGSAGANRMRGNIHSNGQSGSGSNGPAGLDHFNVNGAFPSLTSPIEQQMFFAHHHALQQQFAMQQHQQHQQATATPPYSLQSQHQ